MLNWDTNMSVTGFLCRFSALYVAWLFADALVLTLLHVSPTRWNHLVALAGSVAIACVWFAAKNGYHPEGSEKRRAIIGVWVVTLSLHIVSALGASAITAIWLPLKVQLWVLATFGVYSLFLIVAVAKLIGKLYPAKRRENVAS
jgi:hypothetical protein